MTKSQCIILYYSDQSFSADSTTPESCQISKAKLIRQEEWLEEFDDLNPIDTASFETEAE